MCACGKGGSHGRCVPAVREGVMGDVCLSWEMCVKEGVMGDVCLR